LNLLLDTCAFIWLCSNPNKLTMKATKYINNVENDLFLSDASVLEISIKHSIGKLKLPEAPENWILEQSSIWDINLLSISREDIFESTKLPWIHRDPFDRLIIALAKNHSYYVVTYDSIFKEYSVDIIW